MTDPASPRPARTAAGLRRTLLALTATVALLAGTAAPLASAEPDPVPVGNDHLANGVAAWGRYLNGEWDVPTGMSDLTDVASSYSHTLALHTDGTVEAWGADLEGERDVPAGLREVTAISTGYLHSIALTMEGTVVAWGDDRQGQTDVPAGLGGVTAVAAGSYHTLALRGDGTVAAWGSDQFGATDVPAGLSGVVAIAAGGWNSLALRADGTVVAWGGDDRGAYTAPAGLRDVVAVSVSYSHSLALKRDGTVVTWGDPADSGLPRVPADLGGITAIAAGIGFSVLLTSDGTVVSLHPDGDTELDVPAGITGATGIAVGFNHAFAVGPLPTLTADTAETLVKTGTRYSATFTASGPAATFEVSSGALPAGVALSPEGVVSGRPTTAGDSTFTVSARNAYGTTAGVPHTVTVVPANTPPVVTVAYATDGASYEKGSEPRAACAITDAESGTFSEEAVVTGTLVNGLGTRTATCTWTDPGGLTTTAAATYRIVDTGVPTIAATTAPTAPNAAGWFRSPVSVGFSCADGSGSGIRSCTPARILREGPGQSVTGTAVDNAGNRATTTRSGIAIDTTKPQLSFTSRPEGSYPFGTVLPEARCLGDDALSGLTGDCVITGGGRSVGPHVYRATATDRAGNVSTLTASYTVTPWTIGGLSTSVKSVAAGAATGMTFQVTSTSSAGTFRHSALADVRGVTQRQTSCTAGAVLTGAPTTTLTGRLRYDTATNRYVKAWTVPAKRGTCWTLTVTTADGSTGSARYSVK
ncbi:hypothetical protein GTU71_10800 [Rathayibacter sp. VKM Ac-2762]|uniref:PxKF domain-containing protein n=1 Tax=Rathayibacter sp. VKM Ac-2762 TaxID=2609254 RepID=UPI00132F3343|nr:PxKF domain-containing protein [Rathayibacter sp. VKM Ac-2762]QHF21273.1 hypothetical protein GTU71_10800 [Rathayibacter sp. VKM Ac-2762]